MPSCLHVATWISWYHLKFTFPQTILIVSSLNTVSSLFLVYVNASYPVGQTKPQVIFYSSWYLSSVISHPVLSPLPWPYLSHAPFIISIITDLISDNSFLPSNPSSSLSLGICLKYSLDHLLYSEKIVNVLKCTYYTISG